MTRDERLRAAANAENLGDCAFNPLSCAVIWRDTLEPVFYVFTNKYECARCMTPDGEPFLRYGHRRGEDWWDTMGAIRAGLLALAEREEGS